MERKVAPGKKTEGWPREGERQGRRDVLQSPACLGFALWRGLRPAPRERGIGQQRLALDEAGSASFPLRSPGGGPGGSAQDQCPLLPMRLDVRVPLCTLSRGKAGAKCRWPPPLPGQPRPGASVNRWELTDVTAASGIWGSIRG